MATMCAKCYAEMTHRNKLAKIIIDDAEDQNAAYRARIAELEAQLAATKTAFYERNEVKTLCRERDEANAKCEKIARLFLKAAQKVNSQKHNTFADATEAIADVILEYVNESKAN